MPVMALCRTCDVSTDVELYELKSSSSFTSKYPGKQLFDLLMEIVDINQNMAYETQLPQKICGNCKELLNNCYDFIMQAREANQRLLDALKVDFKFDACLQEAPLEQFLAIKLEPSGEEVTPMELGEIAKTTTVAAATTTTLIPTAANLTPIETMTTEFKSKEFEKEEADDTDEPNEWNTFDDKHSVYSADEQQDIKQMDKLEQQQQQQQLDPLTINKQTRGYARQRRIIKAVVDKPVIDSDAALSTSTSATSSSESCSSDDAPLMQHKLRMQKSVTGSGANKTKIKPYKCDLCEKSYRLRRSLQTHKEKHLNETIESHACAHCTKKFKRKETLERHIKAAHAALASAVAGNTISPKLCERKQAKELDLNLCKPHGCKIIQCMICLQNFTKISDLRSHLSAHPDNITFKNRMETLQEIAISFYGELKHEINETELLTRIRQDLKAEKFVYFYSITNQAGYELRLESSDTESDIDLDTGLPTTNAARKKSSKHKKEYSCDLCINVKFGRKYQLFDHQRLEHAWLDAKYVCRRCDARFLSEAVLLHHWETQCRNTKKRYRCKKCPLRYRWKHNLKAHYKDHKIKNQALMCTHCDRSYDDQKSLTIHILTTHTAGTNLFKCHWCNRKFYRRDLWIKHCKRHGLREADVPLAEMLIKATEQPNGLKRISCKICQLQFEHFADLRAHILMEYRLNLSAHQSYCSMANYSITNAAGFELHLDDSETDNNEDTQSTPPAYKCEVCQVQCRRRYEMFQHQRATHSLEALPHACDKCIFKSVSKNILEHHQRTQCQNTEKKLSCEHCNYKFMWQENLEQHYQQQHADVFVKKNETTTTSDGNQVETGDATISTAAAATATKSTAPALLLNCPHCDRTYMHESRLKNHIRDVHSEGGSEALKKRKEAARKFLCSQCGKDMPTAGALVTHMRRHTGEKPYKCDLCDMRFPRHCEMLQHRRVHTGEKPYHCTVCDKYFAQSGKLKRHMLIHSGLKPHQCTYCEKSYRQLNDLKIHLVQHTGESPFECATCGQSFNQRAALKNHRATLGH